MATSSSVTLVGEERRGALAWALAGAATALGAVIATAQHYFARALDTIPVERRDPVILTAIHSIVEDVARGIWVVAILRCARGHHCVDACRPSERRALARDRWFGAGTARRIHAVSLELSRQTSVLLRVLREG